MTIVVLQIMQLLEDLLHNNNDGADNCTSTQALILFIYLLFSFVLSMFDVSTINS